MRPTTVTVSACVALLACGAVAPAQQPIFAPSNTIIGVAATPGSNASAAATVGTNANTNNYPTAEGPANAIDGNAASKYLNFARTNVGLLVAPSAASVLGSFRFTTANDAPARDPFLITIEGTNDPIPTVTLNSNWSLIYSGASGLAADPGRAAPGDLVSVSNATSYTSYRILVTDLRDFAGANSVQFAEVQFFTPVPEPATWGVGGLAVAALAAARRRWRAA